VSEDNVIKLARPGEFSDALTAVLREGARSLLTQAVEAEIASFLETHADKLTEVGHRRLVRWFERQGQLHYFLNEDKPNKPDVWIEIESNKVIFTDPEDEAIEISDFREGLANFVFCSGSRSRALLDEMTAGLCSTYLQVYD
jgi:hypothetical protein